MKRLALALCLAGGTAHAESMAQFNYRMTQERQAEALEAQARAQQAQADALEEANRRADVQRDAQDSAEHIARVRSMVVPPMAAVKARPNPTHDWRTISTGPTSVFAAADTLDVTAEPIRTVGLAFVGRANAVSYDLLTVNCRRHLFTLGLAKPEHARKGTKGGEMVASVCRM